MLPDCRRIGVARKALAAGTRSGLSARLLLALSVLALTRAGAAHADELATPSIPIAPAFDASRPAVSSSPFVGPLFSHPLIGTSGSYPLPELNEPKSYPSKDFRPHGRSVYDVDPSGSTGDNLTFDKTIWQRLNEYKTRDRIRVLTLWESGVNAVSLQTDRKGDPWLQFTAKLNTGGNAAHGLLDHVLPVTSFTRNYGHAATRSFGLPAGKAGSMNLLHRGGVAP